MHVLTEDYLIEKELIKAVDEFSSRATKTSRKIASTIKAAFSEFSIDIGNTKIVDRRVLPYIARDFLTTYGDEITFTDLNNTIPISEFMRLANITELKFLPDEMVIYARSKKNYPVFVRLNDEIMKQIKRGKQLNYLGYRKAGTSYKKKESDMYFDKVVGIVNNDNQKVFYFGVW